MYHNTTHTRTACLPSRVNCCCHGNNNNNTVPFALRKIFRIISLLVWPLLPAHCRCGGLLLHMMTLSDTHDWWDSSG